MKQWQLFSAVFAFSFSAVFSQSQRDMYDASMKAYESKDYKTFLKLTSALDSLRPFHPTYTYNLASANALNGNREEALISLKRLVLMDNATVFENDEDFKSISQDEGFRNILSLKKTQEKVIKSSNAVVTLSEKELHPESVAYLSKSNVWLSSSIRKSKIVSFDIKSGKCSDWLAESGMLSVMAMKTDVKEEVLWIATAAFREMENFKKELDGKSEILKVDIKTRKILKRFTVDGNHVFGDVFVARNGIVYVSDSAKPIIYKIENNTISEFASFEKDGYNLQGITMNKEQTKLYVADYLKGITVIDMVKRGKTAIVFPDDATAKGIDGLVFYNNSLIAVQNGVKPIRITRFMLNDKQDEITGFKILDNNRPEFNEPALATIVGNKLYFFGNSPWGAYDKNGVLDVGKVTNPILFSCKLDQ